MLAKIAVAALTGGAAAALIIGHPAQAASADDFTFWGTSSTGTPFHWDPSHTVTVSSPTINLDSAVAQLSQATGLTMTVVSTPAADITVDYVSSVEGAPAGTVLAGLTTDRERDGLIVGATIVLSEQTPQNLLREDLIHELGHAVGLDHAHKVGQVMSPVLTGQETYQAGDLAGLRLLGPH